MNHLAVYLIISDMICVSLKQMIRENDNHNITTDEIKQQIALLKQKEKHVEKDYKELTPKDIGKIMKGKNADRIWEACGKINHSVFNREFMVQLIPLLHPNPFWRPYKSVVQMFRLYTMSPEKTKLGGLLISNVIHVNTAAAFVQFYMDHPESCPCVLFPESYYGYFKVPKDLAKNGDMIIESEIIDKEACEIRYVLKCSHCAKQYLVCSREGHCTWWEWKNLD